MKKIIIIYGPTGSGKSNLANLLAMQNNAHIINGDSIQIYDKIKILSASPSENDKKIISHFLFNFFSIYRNYSLDLYIKDIADLLNNSTDQSYIIVGGTGMYINTLINGMINIPAIPDNIREFTRSRFKELGNEKFYSELSKLDPQIIGKIHPNNSHRLMRAYEIKKSTNYSVYDLEYFAKTISVIDDYEITKIYLKPEREFLYKICEMRFDHMISNGAIEEVESIEQNYDQLSLSAKKIIGLTEIYEYLNNRLNLQDATLQAKQKTRNYAKRQYTWFNNQIGHDIVIDFASLSEYEILIKNVISRCTKSFYA